MHGDNFRHIRGRFRDMSREGMLMQHSQGTFQGANGTELFYQAWHPAAQARAIIVGVHGHGDHSGGLRSIIRYLLSIGYCWYGFDLRGHGRSQGKRGHLTMWSDFREDLKSFQRLVMERESNRPIFLVGHSLGGLICLDYAMHYPESLEGIITISPLLDYSAISPFVKLFLRGVAFVRPEFSIEGQTGHQKLTRDPDALKALDADELRHEILSAGLWRETDACRRWVCAHPQDLRVPLLMLYGLADRITPARAIREFFQSVSLVAKERHEYAEARHRPFDDLNRAEVLDHLATWLNSRLGASDCFAPEKRICRGNRNGQAVSEKVMANRA